MDPAQSTGTPREGRRGREARRTARLAGRAASIPYITRNLPLTEVLTEEGLSIIEANAETILQEIGVDFKEYPRALDLLKAAGCGIQGHRVRFPKGLARQLISTAPSQFTQHARNPERSVPIGGNHFTRALTKDMKLTFAKAEHLKRNAVKSPDLRKILSALKSVLADFVGEVQR